MADTAGIITKSERLQKTKTYLRWAALFLGELRDGLTMINMQSTFLLVSKGYEEIQVGTLFFVFGMSQFLFQTPAGYLYDYTENKLFWLSMAGALTSTMTVLTAVMATQDNFMLMVFIKFLQGAITSFIPPGLNSITQGIVGSVGMTQQVAVNEMMNHLGTSIIVLTGSLIAFFLFPDVGYLFVVSPIACIGFLYFLNRIPPGDIDHDAARGLTKETSDDKPQGEYVPPAASSPSKDNLRHKPSFSLGLEDSNTQSAKQDDQPHAETPLQVLRDPILIIFIFVCFLFHTSNGTVLPLVMQTLAIGNGREGVLMSGLCITIAQVTMVLSAKVCGDFSSKYGRKVLFLMGLISVPIRCGILAWLLTFRVEDVANPMLDRFILSTQILDGVGAGVFGTMYILVTSDISGGTGRFGLTLGLTTAAMSIGGTVSGYLGQALATKYDYQPTFIILMVLSLVPAVLYLLCMPETLPANVQSNDYIQSIQEGNEEDASSRIVTSKDMADKVAEVDNKKSATYVEMV
mmetsp:Transcript_19331/g.53762  ORF Transcript_19331/g.53762 Transcript_19331/m.53762 type:complete len:518 (-) Transcript_19331:191-1744(-)|eukprot:CAMPEP_0198119278 /NCGR_PEP_ID=MMETSP1442-20131203/24972_1 /TAXON_ID= /ORGANISM="Craspedostauros australis, Strain CCMP3328" /LENGTH=517 /DNA_ID=CAMNT_0043777711 /DNA_START=215 /DNA_END=1768 /DNA_ORIENTATION=+